MTISEQQLLKQAIDKGYVVFAPKGEHDLRRYYKELEDFPEFSKTALGSSGDMLFVWMFRAGCSPVFEMEDILKFDFCINVAYKSKAMREQRRLAWNQNRFPPAVKAAMDRMGSINNAARIRRYQTAMIVIGNMTEIIQEKMPSDDKGKDAYVNRVAKAQSTIDNITEQLERGKYGVEEESATILPFIRGLLKEHRLTI